MPVVQSASAVTATQYQSAIDASMLNECTSSTVVWKTWSRSILIPMQEHDILASASTIWPTWNQTFTGSGGSNAVAGNVIWTSWQNAPPNLTSELEAQALLLRREENRAAYLVAEGERAKARERAELLLQESLTEEQRMQLASIGYFEVTPRNATGPRRKYRIRRGRSRNVQQVDESGRVLKHLCAHPIQMVPDADTMLAQKLWLESREDEFLRVANHS